MTDSLKSYMRGRQPAELDGAALREYISSMKEDVVPKIEKEIRDNERRATELRYSAAARHRRTKD